MSYCVGNGTLTLNKMLTQEAYDKIVTLNSSIEWHRWCEVGLKEIEIEEDSMKFFDDEDLPELIDALTPLGFVIESGDIEYWGDYEGRYLIDNNELMIIDRDDFGLYFSSYERLVDILNQRGFDCVKKITPEKISAAKQCLADNGVESDETGTVLQAMFQILMDRELEVA